MVPSCGSAKSNYWSDDNSDDVLPNGTFPSENTLTMNVGYEMLNDLRSIYPETIAIVPTRDKEEDAGYDMAFDYDWWKSVALQFKSPDSSGGTNIRSGSFLKFTIDLEQFAGIAADYDSRNAFYVLPPIEERDSLHQSWVRTIFIDVYELADCVYRDPNSVKSDKSRESARFVVPEAATDWDVHRRPASVNSVYMTTENGYESVPSDHIYYWSDIRADLLFGDIGRQTASYTGDHAVISDGGEGPIDEREFNFPEGYTRPPEIIVRGKYPPEQREVTPGTAFD